MTFPKPSVEVPVGVLMFDQYAIFWFWYSVSEYLGWCMGLNPNMKGVLTIFETIRLSCVWIGGVPRIIREIVDFFGCWMLKHVDGRGMYRDPNDYGWDMY